MVNDALQNESITQQKAAPQKERYSFSKLTAFHTCKYGFKMSYLDHLKGIGNCFSSYGTEVHSIMERYAKGELDLWDLADVYDLEFDTAVPEPFPDMPYIKDLRQRYYEQGLNFLQQFGGYDDLKILEVESAFDIEIDDWIFNGIIDLVFEEPNGKLVIRDYKSKGAFKSKREQAEYARQLYLYSLYVEKKYGRYPDELQFLMFRKNNLIKIPFEMERLKEALRWAMLTVEEIRECWDYAPNFDEFYCENLCNHREYCDCRPGGKVPF